MAKITIPNPEVAIGKCSHCGQDIKITPVWYQKLLEIIKALNS